MKNSVEILYPETSKFSFLKNDEMDQLSNQDISSLLMDAFNSQFLLNSKFKKKITNMINLIEFSYSDDREILNNTINSFLDLSNKALTNCIQIDIDSNSNSTLNHPNSQKQVYHIYKSPSNDKNDCWMEDWMEQTCSFKVTGNNMFLKEHDTDDFCYYVDAAESM